MGHSCGDGDDVTCMKHSCAASAELQQWLKQAPKTVQAQSTWLHNLLHTYLVTSKAAGRGCMSKLQAGHRKDAWDQHIYSACQGVTQTTGRSYMRETSIRHSPQPGSAPEDAQDLMGRAVIMAPALQYTKSRSLSCTNCHPHKCFCMNMSQLLAGLPCWGQACTGNEMFPCCGKHA